jgi:hypothetical protein
MSKPKVFLSYSTRDPLSDRLLAQLEDALRNNFEVFTDRTALQPNDDWRRKLYAWLGMCRAAVILLSPPAVSQSSWVLAEATILGWRRTLEKDFTLLPLLMPGIQARDLSDPQGRFAAVNLSLPQWVEVDPNDLLATVLKVEQVLAAGTRDRREGPLLRPRQIIASKLGTIPDKRILRSVAEDALQVDLGGWDPDATDELKIAHGLLTADLERVERALKDLLPLLPVRETACEIVWRVSHVWIDARAAADLARLATVERPPPLDQPPMLAINAHEAVTGEMYVRRACCDDPTNWPAVTPLVDNDTGEPVDDSVGDPVGRIATILLSRMAKKLGLFQGEMKRVTGHLARRGPDRPAFVILPLRPKETDAVDPADVPALRGRLPGCTFLLMTGASACAAHAALGATMIAPQLEGDREEVALQVFRNIRAELEC